MPRENQRRGRAKRKDGAISTSKEDIKQEIISRRVKPALPEPEPEPADDQDFHQEAPQADDPNPEQGGSQWPELDHDSRAYWKQIESRILELERLGATQEDDDQDEEDERKLLLRAALQNLAGQELALATDAEASIILERLLHSMDDYAKRVLAEAFVGQYAQLAQHQYGSHVLQTLFMLGSDTVDREQRGIKQTSSTLKEDDEPTQQDTDPSDTLPTLSSLLTTALQEIIPEAGQLLHHVYGTHIIRTSLLLLAGKSLVSADDKLRSKKSKQWKGSVAPMKNLMESNSGSSTNGVTTNQTKKTPLEFGQCLAALRQTLDVALGKGGASPTLARDAAIRPTSCVAVQILLQLEADAGQTSEPDSLADRLTGGLMSDPDSVTEPSDYLGASLRDSTASHTLETVLAVAPEASFAKLWQLLFQGKIGKLATHPVANFVLAKAIEKLQKPEKFQEVFEELKEGDSVAAMIENWRTGPLKALLDRCSALSILGGELVELLLSGLKLGEEQRSLLVPCLLSMTTYTMYVKTAAFGNPETPNEPGIQGALILQSWLKLPSPHNTPVIDSLVSIPMEMLLLYTSHSVASRVVDAALDSPSVRPRDRRRLLMHFLGSYHRLADDRLGSRVADHCWAAADVYLKDKIAESLVEHQFSLSASQFGRFFVKKVNLPMHQRRHDDWKALMASQGSLHGGYKARGTENKKKVKRDEIDDLFDAGAAAAGGQKNKKPKL